MAKFTKVVVYPKTYRFIPDILLNKGRITERMELTLSSKEILRCMAAGNVFALVEVDGDVTETLLDRTNFSSFAKEIVEDVQDAEATYTVTFNANGGIGSYNSVTGPVGTVVELPTTQFSKEGYTFKGVSRSSSSTSVLSSYTIPDHDETLYAIYKQN